MLTASFLPIKFLIAIVLGAVIGLERGDEAAEGKQTKWQDIGGVRVFSLISLLGGVAGYLYSQEQVVLSLFLFGFFLLLVMIYYVSSSWFSRSTSLTTELAAAFTFLIGFLVVSEIVSVQLTIALAVVLSLILTFKEKVQGIYVGIKQHEISAFLSFALIALVILPFLPNQSYFLTDIPGFATIAEAYSIPTDFLMKLEIINPFKLWFIVALITGIDVVGYVLGRVASQESSWIVTSAIGGFISSTSTTQSLAQQSKKSDKVNQLVGAAVIANLASFLQVFILVAPLNSKWLVAITPVLMLIVLSALVSSIFFLWRQKKGKQEGEVGSTTKKTKEDKIFSLGPAIRFALILVAIRAATKMSLVFFGQAGFFVSSIIASFSGIDAIVINLSEIAGEAIDYKMALLTLVAVNATNLLIKVAYSFFQGKREFAVKFLFSMLFVIGISLVGFVVFPI